MTASFCTIVSIAPGNRWRDIVRNQNCAVLVRVDQTPVLGGHPKNIYLTANIGNMDISMAWADTASQQVEAFCALVEIANSTVW